MIMRKGFNYMMHQH